MRAAMASPRLPRAVADVLEDGRNEVRVSAVSAWEIELKRTSGRVEAPTDLAEALRENGFTEFPLTLRHVAALRDLPHHHDDPFDRMLIAQALVERLTIVTHDRAFEGYPVDQLAF